MRTPEHVKQTLSAISDYKEKTERATGKKREEVTSDATLADVITAHQQLFDERQEQGYSDLPPGRSPEDYDEPDLNAYEPFSTLHTEYQRQDQEVADYLEDEDKKASANLGRAALNARIAQLRANDTPRERKPTEKSDHDGSEYTVNTRTGDVLIGADLRED